MNLTSLLSLHPTSLTVEQENFLCSFNTSTRTDCMKDIAFSLQFLDDPDMSEIAESTVAALQGMADGEFSALTFNPAYFTDDDDEEGE